MTRRKVPAEERKWKCPICNYQRPNIRRLALHLAMKGDERHKEWRKKHDLPLEGTQRIASQVEEIISKNPKEYTWD